MEAPSNGFFTGGYNDSTFLDWVFLRTQPNDLPISGTTTLGEKSAISSKYLLESLNMLTQELLMREYICSFLLKIL